MPKRLCPNCGTKLRKYDNYFCSLCGGKLPSDLVNKEVIIKPKKYAGKKPSGKTDSGEEEKEIVLTRELHFKRFDKRTIYIGTALIVLAFIALLLIYLGPIISRFNFGLGNFGFSGTGTWEETAESTFSTDVSDSGEKNALSLDLSLDSQELSDASLLEYVPAEADLYMEISDIQGFISTFVKEGNFDEDLLEQAPNVLDSHFGLFLSTFEDEKVWTFIFDPTDMEKVGEIIEEIPEDSYWKYRVVEGRLIMTSNERIFSQVRDSKNKKMLNMSLNSEYVRAATDLPKRGKIQVVFLSFVGRDGLRNIRGKGLKVDLINVIDAVLNSGYKSLIIR